jgi:hypothetical protein
LFWVTAIKQLNALAIYDDTMALFRWLDLSAVVLTKSGQKGLFDDAKFMRTKNIDEHELCIM